MSLVPHGTGDNSAAIIDAISSLAKIYSVAKPIYKRYRASRKRSSMHSLPAPKRRASAKPKPAPRWSKMKSSYRRAGGAYSGFWKRPRSGWKRKKRSKRKYPRRRY